MMSRKVGGTQEHNERRVRKFSRFNISFVNVSLLGNSGDLLEEEFSVLVITCNASGNQFNQKQNILRLRGPWKLILGVQVHILVFDVSSTKNFSSDFFTVLI